MFNKQAKHIPCLSIFFKKNVKWGVKEELTMICFVHFI